MLLSSCYVRGRLGFQQRGKRVSFVFFFLLSVLLYLLNAVSNARVAYLIFLLLK